VMRNNINDFVTAVDQRLRLAVAKTDTAIVC
jgi:hypothetical protein